VPSRPPLPEGPFLVVGLARSGLAVARLLREQGAEVRATDARAVGEEALAELAGARDRDAGADSGLDLLPGTRTVVKSPGVPQQAPVVEQAARAGLAVVGELEVAWRLIPNDVIAVTGSNGKTTTVELIGHIHREAGVPVRVAGNVGHGAVAAARARSTRDGRRRGGQLVPARGHGAVRAGGCRACSTSRPTTSTGTGRSPPTAPAKLQVFARQANEAVAVAPTGLGVEDLGGCARRVCFGAAPHAELADRAGHLWWDDEPLIAHDAIRLRGATTGRTPWRRRRSRWRGASRPRRCAGASRRSAASSTGSRRSPATAASST
jgi:UDP-N-acetylmuramoylalanine--D-glutamate ligase